MDSDLLLIAGRSAAGKTTVSAEVSAQLQQAGVGHCRMEGDWLDVAIPQAPPELFDRNFQALWGNYRDFGCTRLIFTNWASIKNASRLVTLMGGQPRVVGVLLTCTDETARQRLGERERGAGLGWHLANLEATPVGERDLDRLTPEWATRVRTDHRRVEDLAAEIVELTGWARS
ncbi:hypothetical protein [Tenggerimyces flavus]|uniref:Uncharacterized protein n=1 Tax=Tenggerimyces flavus TaxID=1708749 RepID=A0ABV7Y5X3_9ACTN|nr:hypothetical protein [Tenggerimyces flavus]MBM7788634.1 hypothetical protein [Tenggerimyces flavus]